MGQSRGEGGSPKPPSMDIKCFVAPSSYGYVLQKTGPQCFFMHLPTCRALPATHIAGEKIEKCIFYILLHSGVKNRIRFYKISLAFVYFWIVLQIIIYFTK